MRISLHYFSHNLFLCLFICWHYWLLTHIYKINSLWKKEYYMHSLRKHFFSFFYYFHVFILFALFLIYIYIYILYNLLSVRLRIRWLYQLQRTNSLPKSGVQFRTLNHIRWWGSISEDLKSMEPHHFIGLLSVMITVIGNRIGDTSSNPSRGYWSFNLPYEKALIHVLISQPLVNSRVYWII